jgi:hypothetical protein
MQPSIRRRLIAGGLTACAAALLAGCGSDRVPSPPHSSNPIPADAANTSAPAYGADIYAAQSVSSTLAQSAQRDVDGATTP